MNKEEYLNRFYLDKEKDIQITTYINNKNEDITYEIRTPNHDSNNLILNLAKIFKVEVIKGEEEKNIIKGIIEPSINANNETVYIFRLNGIKIANIYLDRVEIKSKITTIVKTLMSQTKKYKLSSKDAVVKSYILKKSKFRTDLHTHMNAILSPNILISLGIKNQIRYPRYYIKKLNIKLTKEQKEQMDIDRKIEEKKFKEIYKDEVVTEKYINRKIDDNTYINFADLIVNNIENSYENIRKIAKSLVILKDGQAVFTNLEKLYIYRYVFCKAIKHDKTIKISKDKVKQITNYNISKYVLKMLDDAKDGSIYKDNSLKQDKLLWIARQYQKEGIDYVEITDTDLGKKGMDGINLLEDIHGIMPKIEEETGVKIRFLVGIRRIPLTIIKDQKTSSNYLRDTLEALVSYAKSPYVMGSDFIGEEINDISELKPVINFLVQYINNVDKDFTIKIHAGETEGLRSNVRKSIECIKEATLENQIIPRYRLRSWSIYRRFRN